MKALSLWQPWASAIARGLKKIETRSWRTNHRGLLAIHAAKRYRPEQERLRARLAPDLVKVPLGEYVALVRVVRCYEMSARTISAQSDAELAWGDWQPGRFAWELELVHAVWDVEGRGRQRLWTPAPAEKESILRCGAE